MKPITIYHVDDDQDELEFFNQIATDLGHTNKSFASGADLLECINAGGRPDIIFVDIYMPRMTGLEVATLLRDFSSMAETPIIALRACRAK
jgi:CheY-like chemotaxis protein